MTAPTREQCPACGQPIPAQESPEAWAKRMSNVLAATPSDATPAPSADKLTVPMITYQKHLELIAAHRKEWESEIAAPAPSADQDKNGGQGHEASVHCSLGALPLESGNAREATCLNTEPSARIGADTQQGQLGANAGSIPAPPTTTPAAQPAEPTDAKCEMCDNVDYFGQRCHLHKGHAGTHHRAPAAPVKSAFQLIKGMAEKLRAVAGVVRSLDANDADAYLCEQAANNLAQFLGIYDWIPKYRNTAPATDDLVTRLNAATRPLIIYQSTDGTTTRKVLADDALRLQQLAREASIEVQRQAREIAELRNANSSFASNAICHGSRADGLLTCPKAPCDYCLQWQLERAERAEAELHKANIDSANLLAECSDMSVDIEKYRGEIAALRMAVKDDAQWAQENERLTKERDELRTMLQTTNQANVKLATLADKYKWQVRDTCTRAERAEAERDVWKDKAETRGREGCEARAERDALRADAERYLWLREQMTHEHSGPHVGWTLGVLLSGDDPDAAIDAARGKVK